MVFFTLLGGLSVLLCLFLAQKLWPTSLESQKKKHPKAPPFEPSITSMGPKQLFANPLEFVPEQYAKHQTNAFSCHMLGGIVTFVRGKENVERVTKAPEEHLQFAEAYALFLRAFGRGILTHQTATKQVALLKRYLRVENLIDYVNVGYPLVREVLSKAMPDKSGHVDLSQLLLSVTFRAATRNFLGEEILKSGILESYEYGKVFGSFELAANAITLLMPWLNGTRAWIERNWMRPNEFSTVVQRLANEVTVARLANPSNVFEDIVSRRKDKDGPTMGDKDVMVGLVKFFVFGTGFNSFNMMNYFVREVITLDALQRQFEAQSKKYRDLTPIPTLWELLREEQKKLDEKHGATPSLAKIADMTLLRTALRKAMSDNCFPFLLRRTKEDFQLADDIVIPKDQWIAFSPRLEHLADYGANLTFGDAVHACPAERYAWNSMCLILSELIKGWDFTPVSEIERAKNSRLITFSMQPPLVVNYQSTMAPDLMGSN